MKLKLLSTIAVSSMLLVACGGGTTHEEETAATTEQVAVQSYTADTEASVVNWKGEVAGVYGHNGYVKLKSGTLSLAGNSITGGEFVADMTNIVPTDSASYKDEDHHRITDLQGHLSTADFFNTAEFPTASFTITGVEGNTVKGDLTVRGKTNAETIEIQTLDVNEDGVTVKGKLVFDRQKYDVAWVHFMKDMILSDDIVLDITLVAKK